MQPLDEDWHLLLGLLPAGWQRQAVFTGACERLRGFSSASNLLRTLLFDVGNGYSLRETAVRAKAAGIAEVSDVARMKSLRNSEDWLHGLCVSLLEESGWKRAVGRCRWRRADTTRALDGTLVKAPGHGGALWRIHYSVRIPSLVCDHFELTSTKGAGTGETLGRFAAGPEDLVLADRGFCKPNGVEALTRRGAAVMVRLNTSSLPLWDEGGRRFALAERIEGWRETGAEREWPVWVQGAQGRIAGGCVPFEKAKRPRRGRAAISRGRRNKEARSRGRKRRNTPVR